MLHNADTLPLPIRGAIDELIEYNLADELRDFEESPSEGHILMRMILLRRWLLYPAGSCPSQPTVADIAAEYDLQLPEEDEEA